MSNGNTIVLWLPNSHSYSFINVFLLWSLVLLPMILYHVCHTILEFMQLDLIFSPLIRSIYFTNSHVLMGEFGPTTFHTLDFVYLSLNLLILGSFSSINIPSLLILQMLLDFRLYHELLILLSSLHSSVLFSTSRSLCLLWMLSPHFGTSYVVDHEVFLWTFIIWDVE